jgi:hypothetical protein
VTGTLGSEPASTPSPHAGRNMRPPRPLAALALAGLAMVTLVSADDSIVAHVGTTHIIGGTS